MSRPGLLLRCAAAVAMAGLWISPSGANPAVRAEHLLGLSPCRLEAWLGVKCLFCGMTGAFHLISTGRFREAVAANCWSPIAFALALYLIVAGRAVRLDTRRRELCFFLLVAALTLAVNLQDLVRTH